MHRQHCRSLRANSQVWRDYGEAGSTSKNGTRDGRALHRAAVALCAYDQARLGWRKIFRGPASRCNSDTTPRATVAVPKLTAGAPRLACLKFGAIISELPSRPAVNHSFFRLAFAPILTHYRVRSRSNPGPLSFPQRDLEMSETGQLCKNLLSER